MASATDDSLKFTSFNGEQLRASLVETDRELAAEDLAAPCHIVIVGGAMIALRDSARVTCDVDRAAAVAF